MWLSYCTLLVQADEPAAIGARFSGTALLGTQPYG